tara:strand:+ start:247 stop:1068 length:822 start_codon:yes stop_codon:yes gene_type:complete
MKIFIFGFGQVSKELAKKLSNEKKINFKIVSRNTENFLDYEFLKIDFFKNKLNLSDSMLISTVPPNEKDEDYVLKNIPESNLKSFSRIIYISSTSVYQSGEVNELTIPKPTTRLGIRRLSIEKSWQKLNTRTVIIRPSGIYSNSKNILTKFLKGDHKIIFKKNHFTNRIHIEDLIGIIFSIIKAKNIDGIINATDSFFIDNFDLIDKLSRKFSIPKPTKINYEDKSINKNIKSFYQVSKKVYSNRLKDDLGYKLIYPKVDKFLNSLLKKELKL